VVSYGCVSPTCEEERESDGLEHGKSTTATVSRGRFSVKIGQ